MITTSIRVLPVFALLALSLSSCASDKESDAVKAINSANAGAASAAAAASSAMAQLESAGLPAMSAASDTLASLKAAAEQALAAQSSAAGAAAVQSESPASIAGETEPPKAATAGSPCELLTEAEVSAALGAKVTAIPTEQGEPLGGKQCNWTSATVPVKNYSIALTRTDGMMKTLVDAGQSAKSLYTDSKKMFSGSEPVPGIGDEAVTFQGTILALKGDVFVYASTIFGTSVEANAALRSLTATAVGRL